MNKPGPQIAGKNAQDDAFASRLTALLDEEHTHTPGLERRIMRNLPARDALERLYTWFATGWLRPALTAAMPLVIGFALGFNPPEADTQFENEVLSLAFAETFEEMEDD